MEQITEDGHTFTCYPDSERRHLRVYYWGRVGGKRTSYHRYVWEKTNGPMPGGYEIHHSDGDPFNNDIANLECIQAGEHQRLHGRMLTDEQREARRKWMRESVLPKAVEWHGSPEGIEWHREQGRLSYAKREYQKLVCEQCGSEYETKNRTTNRFCSNKCTAAHRRASGIDDEQRTCEVCGVTYAINKYKKNRTCSRQCGSRLRGMIKSARAR